MLLGTSAFKQNGTKTTLTGALFREILIGLSFQDRSGDYKVKLRFEELVLNVSAGLDYHTQ
jgi:hypothetical protein